MINPFEQIDNRLLAIEQTLKMILEKQRIEREFYSIEEAAERLNVSQITLYRNTKNGTIPCKRIGSRLMIPSSYVDH